MAATLKLKTRQVEALRKRRLRRLLGGSNEAMSWGWTTVHQVRAWRRFWSFDWTWRGRHYCLHFQARWPFVKLCRGICICDINAVLQEVNYERVQLQHEAAQAEINATMAWVRADMDRAATDLHEVIADLDQMMDRLLRR